MKTWKVIVTEDVERDLDNAVYYLLFKKKNVQAAAAVIDDYDETVEELSRVAGIVRPIEDEKLQEYRRISFRRHDYYLVYRVEKDTAIVDRMLHKLQDIDNILQ